MSITRRDPQKKIKDSLIAVAGSFSGTVITSDEIDPARLGTGTRNGTKFLRDDGTWQDASGSGSSGVGSRADVPFTTASLDHEDVEQATAPLGISFIPFRIEVDRAARVQLYQTDAAATADAARNPGVDPLGEHGLILDVLLDGSTGLIWDVVDPPTGTNMEATPVEDITYRITNLSGSTSTVDVIITRLLLETSAP